MTVTVRTADYRADHAAIRGIRFAVFVDEQHVPAELELDERDPFCVHVLAWSGDVPVGTGRMDLGARGKAGRVAVLAAHRGGGVGTALMEALHGIAREAGLDTVWCNAQVSALGFYERLGYRVVSGPFFEAGIEHRRMECRLRPNARPIDDADGG